MEHVNVLSSVYLGSSILKNDILNSVNIGSAKIYEELIYLQIFSYKSKQLYYYQFLLNNRVLSVFGMTNKD